jgi:hypothetical protein
MWKHLLLLTTLLSITIAQEQERLVIREPRCPTNEDPFNPTHLAHPSDCTKFYKCESGRAHEFTCPRGHHWNSRMGYCDFPDLANCRPVSISRPQVPAIPNNPNWGSTRILPTRVTTPARMWPSWSPSTTTGGWWTTPRPTWPSTTTGGWWTTPRPTWQPSTTTGGWWTTPSPTWQPSTTGGWWTPRPTGETSTTGGWWTTPSPNSIWTSPNPNAITPMNCPAVDVPGHNIFFANPFDCGSYYQCNSGRAVLFQCPRGLEWSTFRQCCDFPTVARCAVAQPYNNKKEDKPEEVKEAKAAEEEEKLTEQ